MRDLTERQSELLAGVADREEFLDDYHEKTKVIGWSGLGRGGPVVRFADGTEALIPYSGKVSARITGIAA